MDSRKFKIPFSSCIADTVSEEQQVIIVSFFGKSSCLSRGCKAGVVDVALGRQVFRPSVLDDPEIDADILCNVDGFYDSKQRVVFLHVRGVFDVHALVSTYQHMETELDEKGYLTTWAKLKHSYARALLFLFSVSHVLVCTHPTHTFDASYIRLFRALDSVRQKVQGSLGDLLSTLPKVSREWVQLGRLCSPRMLFLFESCPACFRDHVNDRLVVVRNEPMGSKILLHYCEKNAQTMLCVQISVLLRISCINCVLTSACRTGKGASVKKLEHALEDQIYHILRKNRVISKNSCNSLFAIPANQEFVYVETKVDPMQDWRSHLINSLISLCNNPYAGTDVSQEEYTFHTPSFLNELNTNGHTFKRFLQQHVELAFVKGFDDNVGRHSAPAPFEIPTWSVWVEAASKIFSHLSGEKGVSVSSFSQTAMETLRGLLDTDVKFSENRCGKVLPLAIATYQENLPAHYTREYHKGRLTHALSVFAVHARGPLFEDYARQLEEECESFWKSGRQMCQVLSLTGHPCTNPLHRGGGDGAGGGELQEEDGIDRMQLPLTEHSSGVRYVSACNCGRKQGPREDPFSMRAANYDFYVLLGKECGCNELDSISFPVFTPSTKDFRAAQLFSGIRGKEGGSGLCRIGLDARELGAGTPQGSTQGFGFAFVSGQSGGSDMIAEETSNLNLPQSESEPDTGNSAIVIRVSDAESEAFREKGLVRQPSTTEYLPGMLHSDSPPGLLPQFPSWSLVCMGPSSLYSHNLGLQEQQQAGLMPGSAFLLPWDLTVRYSLLEHQRERTNAWPTVLDAAFSRGNKAGGGGMLQRPRKTKRDAAEFVVKIFVGVEYECPRGHRFMCSAPDKVLKTGGSGLVKDNGNKVTASDMPLFFPCPCKNSKPLIAQLMRVHVVTPKAPVHVTLNPRVQPAPAPCPVFVPGCEKPIRLSQSAYWVLRLPYVYVGDHGPYVAPKEPVSVSYGRLLAGMYGIMEVAASEK